MNTNELRRKMDEYLDTLDDLNEEEWHGSQYDRHFEALSAFVEWLDKPAREKEARRQLYEQLKKEFGDA
jgi:hypothetical protein